MIHVILNGEKKALVAECNLAQAIVDWQLTDQTFAVAVNQQFVPKTTYTDIQLKDGDAIELLVPMQGG